MTPLLQRLLLVIALLTSQIACTATSLAPYEATYTTKLKGIKVTGVRKLVKTEANRYRMSWKARALWMRLEESTEFEVIEGRYVRPITYEYKRRGLGSDRPIRIDFDYATNTVHGSKGNRSYDFALQPHTQDKLSYQVQMQLDLMHEPNQPLLDYAVAGHNRIKQYAFNHTVDETLETAIGEDIASVYVRKKTDSATYLWLSPQRGYLPVKIEQHEDGKKTSVDIKNWRAAQPNGQIALNAIDTSDTRVTPSASEAAADDKHDSSTEEDF